MSEESGATGTGLTEEEARALAERAVDEAGGPRNIYRNPRHPYAMKQTRDYVYDGHEVELRPGEISSPAIVSVGGYVFQIHEDGIELLMRPSRRRS